MGNALVAPTRVFNESIYAVRIPVCVGSPISPGHRVDSNSNEISSYGPVFVDPRSDPEPPAHGLPSRATGDEREIAELVNLCRAGRIYAVERWIAAGHPFQVAHRAESQWRGPSTPLSVAIESGQRDLAFLLLCNGYRTDLEPESPLDLALRDRSWDFVDLLLAWGADATAADPDAVLGTYQVALMDRFWELGLDLTRDQSLAYYLSETASNKPAYGWAKRHHDDPRVAHALALALGEAVSEDHERAVALLVWAGADPHRRVPSLRYSSGDDESDEDRSSAIELAVLFGHGNLLKYLKPDPDLDNFDELWESVCDRDAVDHLFDLRPPRDWSKAIRRNVSRMSWWYPDRSGSRTCLERIFEHHWGRLSTLEHRECQDLRRDLLKMKSDSDLAWLLKKLAKPHHCDEKIFAELVRTPSIKEKMGRLGLGELLPPRPAKRGARRVLDSKHAQRNGQSAKSQEESWLSSLTPKVRAAILDSRISREQLYEEVWAEPITKVAGRYGVSDVAVAKWCRKLNVPRPGRGYWAQKSAGRRVKPWPLPEAATAQETYVNRPKPSERRPAPPTKVPGLELFEKPIPVSELSDPEHPLVARTRLALAGAGTQEDGIIHPRGREGLDVGVCEASVGRALRIMSALIRALERAGFAVEVSASSDSEGRVRGYKTEAVIHNERIPFSIAEATQRVERPPTDEERAEMRRNPWTRGPFYAYRPTGKLSLQIEGDWYRERHRRTWSDGKRCRLEHSLYSVVRGLLISADALQRRHQEAKN